MTRSRPAMLAAASTPPQGRADAATDPDRPIPWLVGCQAGGGSGILARVVASVLAERLGQPIPVENRPGAAGRIALEAAARAAPDSLTMCGGGDGTMILTPLLYRTLRYDPVRDFQPVGALARLPLILAVGRGVAADSPQAFVALAKRSAQPMTYASPGNGSPHHLARHHLARWSACAG